MTSTGLGLRDRVTRVVEAATTPLLPRDYLDLFIPLRNGADLRGKVVEKRHETADAVAAYGEGSRHEVYLAHLRHPASMKLPTEKS